MLTESAAQQLASAIELEWSDGDRELLAPLIDGEIAWLGDDELDALARPLVARFWDDELREDIERALAENVHVRFVARKFHAARDDLDRGPEQSRLALAVVRQAAIDLTGDAMFPGRCLCCVDDVLGCGAPNSQQLVAAAAAGIVLRADPEFGTGLPNDDARERGRQRVLAFATLTERSLPRASRALADLAAGPLPPPAEDEIWRAAVAERRTLAAAWN